MSILIVIGSILTLLVYFYYQDVNKEPIKRLIEAFIIGITISLQINYLQEMFYFYFSSFLLFQTFILAGLIEEGLKFIGLRFTLFRANSFNEPADGITYAVFLSLGFATVESILAVLAGESGLIRAFTTIPAHALFAVSMGYYIGKYKFNNKKIFLILALLIPGILHGIYNTLVEIEKFGLIIFIPYIIFLWIFGLIKIKKLNKK